MDTMIPSADNSHVILSDGSADNSAILKRLQQLSLHQATTPEPEGLLVGRTQHPEVRPTSGTYAAVEDTRPKRLAS